MNNYSVTFDWKVVVAAGASTVGIISFVKMDASEIKEVVIHGVNLALGYINANIGA